MKGTLAKETSHCKGRSNSVSENNKRLFREKDKEGVKQNGKEMEFYRKKSHGRLEEKLLRI